MEQTMNVPCQVCAVTSTKGEITPLWCKYQDPEGEIKKITISEVKPGNGIHGIRSELYECISYENDRKAVFLLECDFESHKWRIVKRLI